MNAKLRMTKLLWMFAFMLTFIGFSTQSSFAQIGGPDDGIADYGFNDDPEVCRIEIKNTAVNICIEDLADLDIAGHATYFSLKGGVGYLYWGKFTDPNPANWDTGLRMVNGSSTTAGGTPISYKNDDHDQGQTGYQVWVSWWNGVSGSGSLRKRYEVDIRACCEGEEKSDENDLYNVEVLDFETCYGYPMEIEVTDPAEGFYNYTVHLPDWANGAVPVTLNWTISPFATSDPEAPFVHTFTGAIPLEIEVEAENGDIQVWTISAVYYTTLTGNNLLSFSLMVPKVYPEGEYFEAVGTLNEATKTYFVSVPCGTDISNLGSKFTLSKFASMTHSEDAAYLQYSYDNAGWDGEYSMNDYSTPVAFTVWSENCKTLEYLVVVTVEENTGNLITLAELDGMVNRDCPNGYDMAEGYYSEEYNSTTGPDHGVITFEVPYGFDFSDFELTLTTDPEEGVYVEGLVTSVTPPAAGAYAIIDLTVYAENGVCTRDYQIKIKRGEPSTLKQLLTFNFLKAKNSVLPADVIGTISQESHRIDLVVPFAVNLTTTELIASFTHSPFSCVYLNGPLITDNTLQFSGVSENLFDGPVTYMVKAEDGSEAYYNVYVTKVPADTQNWLANLTLSGQEDCLDNSLPAEITYDEATKTYTVRMRNGRDAGLEMLLDFDIPALATCDVTPPVSIPTNANKVIKVTAEDGTVATYTIKFNWVTPSDKKQITYFAFGPLVGGKGNSQLHLTHVGNINETAKTITVNVPYGTNVTALKATFELNDKYARMTRSEENFDLRVNQESGVSAVNYTTPAAFTVYDEACNTVEYFVTVVVLPNDGNYIVDMDAAGEVDFCYGSDDVAGVVEIEGLDITVTFPAGTDHSSIAFTGSLSDGATMVPDFDDITWGTTSLVVTAADGVATRTYTLEIVESEEAETGSHMLTFGFLADHPGNEDAGLTEDRWGVINHDAKRIDVKVPFLTDLTKLIAEFTTSKYACVYLGCTPGEGLLQVSGSSVQNYSTALTFSVVAQDGSETCCYNVYVTKDAPATDKWLQSFKVHGLPYCFGQNTYDLTEGNGITREGQNILVSVKNSTDVTNLSISFTIPSTATVSPNPATTKNFSGPVSFTVTAQDGSTAVFVVTVTKRAVNNDAKILAYWFDGGANGFAGNAVGTVNENAKMITVWVPWGTSKAALKASFTLSSGAQMTHSEDTPMLQVSGVTANDFTTPVAYTVWSESCKTVEYFVTVNIIPDTNTGISQFTFPVEGCVCTGVSTTAKIDSYARRIYVQLPYTMNLSNLAPSIIGIANGAVVSPAAGVAKNFAAGPVKYTVTAPDGVTQADWMVYVTNPPCKEADIKTWSLNGDLQVGSATIDAATGTIKVVVKATTTAAQLSAVTYTATLSCGATICCNTGACAGQEIDLSDMTHTCVVTAQDKSVTKDWTITVTKQDVTKPTVTTWSVMAYNCTDSVAVQSNEAGYVVIVNSSKITAGVASYNLATSAGRTSLVNDRMGNYATAIANQPVYIMTNGLYSGEYFAFAVDASGNISNASEQKLWLDICDVEVANLTALRTMPVVWRYTVTGEVLVSYEETRTGGNLKFVQDAGAGIRILDKNGILDASFGEGTGLTRLMGYLETGTTLTFVPCCTAPTKSSTGNVITPKALTFDEYKAQCYTGIQYESMLVKVTTPMIAFDDYGTDYTVWKFNNLDLATITAKGDYEWLIQQVFNANYIGDEIPTVPTIYQGIRTNVMWGSTKYGLFTPRKKTDIMPVTEPMILGNPNPAYIKGVLPGTCEPVVIDIINQGVGNLNITALYLDDLPGTDMFHLIAPPAVPFTIGTWAKKSVTVHFCPVVAGDKSTNLIVEYGTGKVLIIPINGETAIIKDMIYCQNFNSPHPSGSDFGAAYDGWKHPSDNSVNLQNYVSNAWVSYDGSNVMNMRPRATIGGVRQTTWMVSPGVKVTGTNPVITWVETASSNAWAGAKNSPRNLYVSTNGVDWTLVDSYNTKDMPDAWIGQGWRTKTYPLAAYIGQTIWWKWELISVANEYTYWCLDNICFQERITTPIISGAPNPGDFGGVQVGENASLAFTVKNVGISVLNVKKVEISGVGFTLTDANTYPVEVLSVSGDWAYSLNGKPQLDFSVTFAPTVVGAHTGKIKITYGLYEDNIYEIPLLGNGLSCLTATEAFVGENHANGPNSWFKYTAERFQITQITSCDPRNTITPYAYSYDSFLRVFSDCAGTKIAENDDMEGACTYNRASSRVEVVMNEGETIYLFWDGIFANDCATCNLPFYFHINPNYPIDGDVCETAIPLTLPVVNHFGTTVGFNDDYNSSPCSPFSNYMDGNDKVYSIDLPYEGYLTGSILGAYGSIHVLDKCPKTELERVHCKAFASGPNGGSFDKRIDAGFYYVIISTWAPPQTVDFLLNLSFRGVGMEDNELVSSLSVYPNPTTGKFMVSISSQEATDYTIELVTMSGQVVYRNEVKAAYSVNNEIDASTYAKGVYYLKVNDGSGVKVEKVVVQ